MPSADTSLMNSSSVYGRCTEDDDNTGEDTEREIPYMKGYTVFNDERLFTSM
jgi:antirestriction protein ArdC